MNVEGDLVLIYMDRQPAFFARIEEISPDPKPDWWQVKMLVLQVPLMVITWILREAYINGTEFTMGGRPVRLEKVVSPEAEESASRKEETTGRKSLDAPRDRFGAPLESKEGKPEKDSARDSNDDSAGSGSDETPEPRKEKGKVVSLFDRQKKNHRS